MIHYIIEVALWSLGLFLLGCVIGGLARHFFGAPGNNPPAPDERADGPQPEQA